MKFYASKFLLLSALFIGSFSHRVEAEPLYCPELLDSTQTEVLTQESIDLCQFTGQPLLLISLPASCNQDGSFQETQELQEIQELHKAYAAQGLVILGFINQEVKSKSAENFLSCAGDPNKGWYTFEPNLSSSNSPSVNSSASKNTVFQILEQLGAQATPKPWHRYLIDAEGNLVLEQAAANSGRKTAEKLEEHIQKLLAASQ